MTDVPLIMPLDGQAMSSDYAEHALEAQAGNGLIGGYGHCVASYQPIGNGAGCPLTTTHTYHVRDWNLGEYELGLD